MFYQIQRDFLITGIGYYNDRVFSKGHNFKGERHDFTEIVYVHAGSVQVVETENVYILTSGDLLIHAPMEFHCIKSYGGTEPHVYNISVTTEGRLPPQLFAGVFHLDRQMQAEFLSCGEMTRQLLSDKQHMSHDGQRTAENLTAFLLALCSWKAHTQANATDGSAQIYRRLVKDMQAAVCMDLTLAQIAAQGFVSISYLKQLFRQYANTTPKRFYDELRIKHAVTQLKEGKAVTEIAESMGFSSPNFFATFFKRQMGMTPSAYKKSIR